MRRHVVLVAILGFVLVAGIHHPYLFGCDEPREAEIARETLMDGHWITPHLCGLPFLEKPPLYYDLVAAAYKLTDSITPPVARSVSVLFALIMLAAVFFFACRWAGPRSAWLSVLILLAMPKFHRYSHTILLDIAVGAFCTIAMVAFIEWEFGARRSHGQGLLCLFYFGCAGAFLTKGVIGLLHILLIVGAFLLVRRRWSVLRRLLSPLPMLLFFVPVIAWVLLYYREGGVGYLHEHFVNNTIGRALRVHFALPGVNLYHTDLGNQAPWHFYLSSLPRMAGAAVAILPLALWDECGTVRRQWRNSESRGRRETDIRLLLVLWAVLPPVILSFSSIKETSYILPSYSAFAVLAGCWVDRRLTEAGFTGWCGTGCLAVVFPVLAMNGLAGLGVVRWHPLLICGTAAPAVIALAWLLYARRLIAVTFLLLAVALSGAIIYHSRSMLLRSDGCDLAFGRQVWSRVDEAPLFLYVPNDPIRGSIPFSGNRLAREINLPEQLRAVLCAKNGAFVLTRDSVYHAEQTGAAIRGMDLQVVPLHEDDHTGRGHQFVLIRNAQEKSVAEIW